MRISDWSSDVCSSDLQPPRAAPAAFAQDTTGQDATSSRTDRATDLDRVVVSASTSRIPNSEAALPNTITVIDQVELQRSEERRVGKEGVSTCRSRWSPYH